MLKHSSEAITYAITHTHTAKFYCQSYIKQITCALRGATWQHNTIRRIRCKYSCTA